MVNQPLDAARQPIENALKSFHVHFPHADARSAIEAHAINQTHCVGQAIE